MDSYVLVDTFGMCSPEASNYLVEEVMKRTDKTIEMHCYNSFGLVVANSLVEVMADAKIVHTTVNGLGVRVQETRTFSLKPLSHFFFMQYLENSASRKTSRNYREQTQRKQ